VRGDAWWRGGRSSPPWLGFVTSLWFALELGPDVGTVAPGTTIPTAGPGIARAG
jgi:hypothetical protein